MTQDEIIELAQTLSHGWWLDDEKLKTFAKLVAAKEQERICRQIAALHDSIMLASHATLTKRGEA